MNKKTKSIILNTLSLISLYLLFTILISTEVLNNYFSNILVTV